MAKPTGRNERERMSQSFRSYLLLKKEAIRSDDERVPFLFVLSVPAAP
jgi:hypothetical protein